jgi:hypothetical protein
VLLGSRARWVLAKREEMMLRGRKEAECKVNGEVESVVWAVTPWRSEPEIPLQTPMLFKMRSGSFNFILQQSCNHYSSKTILIAPSCVF